MNTKAFVVKGGIALLILSALVTVWRLASKPRPTALSQVQFEEAFRSNWISQLQITYDPASPYLHEVRGMIRKRGMGAEEPFVAKVRLTEKIEGAGVLSCQRIDSVPSALLWQFWKR